MLRRGRFSSCQRFDVAGVLHEQQQLPLGLGVQEQGAGADVGLVRDLLGRHIVNAVLGQTVLGQPR